jgi:hypothetical protein
MGGVEDAFVFRDALEERHLGFEDQVAVEKSANEEMALGGNDGWRLDFENRFSGKKHVNYGK